MSSTDVDANIRAQAALYGEPLGLLVRRCADVLGLTQARTAEVLGVSAPMLSQLVNGHRVKLGNPAAVSRLQAMYAGAAAVEEGRMTKEEALAAVASQEVAGVVTSHSTADVGTIRTLFRAEGSVEEYEEAAAALATSYPRIAALLRRYGGHDG